MEAARTMAKLGDGPLGKARLFLVTYLGPGRFPRERRVRLRLRAFGRSFSCWISDYTQLLVVREIFVDEDYRIEQPLSPQTIVDLGSNMGASLIYFRLRYPTARIVGVEPDPLVFSALRRNVAPFHGIEVLNAAVASSTGEMPFFRYPRYSWASSLVPIWGTDATKLTVEAKSLDDLLDDVGLESVDLLKIDIEGGEWDVLPSVRELGKVRAIIGEIHRVGTAPPQDLLACLSGFRVSITLASDTIVRFLATKD
jgi:FkbM family methyltransferase